jgi:hypothetical protein
MIRDYPSFSLSLDVMTTSGKQIKMKFYNCDDYYDDDIHHISNMVLVPFEESIDYRDYYTSEKMWTN